MSRSIKNANEQGDLQKRRLMGVGTGSPDLEDCKEGGVNYAKKNITSMYHLNHF